MIEVRNLCYRYPGRQTDAVHDVTLDIPETGIVAIMGSNGSGKSTLARCINGLLVPTRGSVSVDGMPIGASHVQNIRRRVGLVFQDPTLQITSTTVERELAFGLENMCVSYDEMHERVDRQLKLLGFEKYRDASPSSLSGGEQQRLAIGAVMLLDPKYVIFDEATSLLSGISRRSVIDMMLRLHSEQKVSLILITQFPSEAMLAERLIILHAGSVVFDKTPSEVFHHVADLSALGVPIPLRSRLGQMA